MENNNNLSANMHLSHFKHISASNSVIMDLSQYELPKYGFLSLWNTFRMISQYGPLPVWALFRINLSQYEPQNGTLSACTFLSMDFSPCIDFSV
jgi:hypothetical protein